MQPAAADLDALRRELEAIVGERRVSSLAPDLDTYARDMWPRLLLSVRDGVPLPYRSHMVVWPESAREVMAIIRAARQRGVPIVPYGGGSGVCGGAVPLHGGVTLDLKRMTAMSEVDREDLVCDVEAGLNGERFERALNHRGYTLGHFPSSIYCSTVGGWLATRAAGQMSTKYGKIEDMVAGVTVVTGRGQIIETDELARASSGPNWTQLLVGSEGTLGVITSARLRVRPAPAIRVMRGFEFPDAAAGVEAMRRVLQRGLAPAVMRLYNEFDTFVHAVTAHDAGENSPDRHRLAPTPKPGSGALPTLNLRPTSHDESLLSRLIGSVASRDAAGSKLALRRGLLSAVLSRPRILNALASTVAERVSRQGCLLIVGVEGARIRTEVEASLAFSELERAGGRDLGEEPGRTWFEHRYAVSYNMSKAFYQGVFVDTMEVASTWECLLDMYDEVRAAIGQHAAVMAHFSHAYPEGCSIYFSFAGRAETRADAERLYDAIWRDGLAAATRAGGTISHHHGVGLLKGPAMLGEHRESLAVLRALKRSFDPSGIMNPGKLGMMPGDGV